MKRPLISVTILLGILAIILLFFHFAAVHGETDIETLIGHDLAPLTIAPFVLILLGIAILPLIREHWWESNRNKAILAVVCAAPIFVYFIGFVEHGASALVLMAHEYYAFIILLAALFTITGGIHLEGDLKATPEVNTGFLLAGGLLASFIGTTGAAMLLIRPLLRTNQERRNTRHIFIFFIFIVANIGGSLLPIGDPPLFLGFLRGVPFFWTLGLWKEWMTAIAILLVIFYVWDKRAYAGETRLDRSRDEKQTQPLRIHGKINFLFLFGVIAAVVFLNGDFQTMREPVLVLLAIASFLIDSVSASNRKNPDLKTPRERNHFTFHAINEVAILFAGIFVTMLPAICLLKAHGAEFGVTEPWQFFWLTGILSSFLDNAPTYVTFMSLGQGLGLCSGSAMECVAQTGVPASILVAISLGAVYMGANTYIGNAPNFMVKAIVDEAGVKMPSFFGYMAYSVGILIPVFTVIMMIFLL